jgi:hypothetical protein
MFSTRVIFKFLRTYSIIILGAAGLIVYLIYKNLKNKANQNPPLPELPNGGQNVGANYQATATALATKLEEVTSGIFTSAAVKETIFVSLLYLTDDQLVYVYRVFNDKYYKSNGGQTMTAVIDDEWNVSAGGVRDRLVDRLTRLNCPK